MIASAQTGVRADGHGRNEEERRYYALNRKVYPWLAPVYDALTARVLRAVRREVARRAGVGPGSRVLDVATGTGEQAFAFAEAGAGVTAVDLSDAMLRVARRKNRASRVRFLQADATALDFADGCFDLTAISFALHEMPERVRIRVLREMTRVTKEAGQVVVVDYGLPKSALWATVVYHFVKLYERDYYARFVRSDWHALLHAAGLEVREDCALLAGNVRMLSAVHREPPGLG